ncbi:MAG: AAA family ATPase [Roseivirga sp.]|nr:AAA family ATPase [Roseivirga sp.]
MRIRKLTFKNINSLKGEHEVNFNALPLKTAGIFAITGPTGSGKSTILDVISLALFNKIPRFKQKITKKEIQELGSILTHHTTEASASIEYEIKGRVYLSSWSVAKTRNNTLKDYHMELMDDTGTILDLKKSEVPEKNEEIIGLEYNQFVKSIILSQGEFSKFLKADKNERGQLLENLTGTSVYRKIGARAFAKFKEVNERANQEKSRLEDIRVLSAEERVEIENGINQAKEDLASLDKVLAEQEALEQVKRELISIQRELTQNAEEKERLRERNRSIQPELKRLKLHEKLSPAAGDIELHKKANREISESQHELTQKQDRLTQSQAALKALLTDLTGLTGQEVSPQSFIDSLNAFEQEVLELDRQKAESRQKGIDQRARINQIKAGLSLPLGDKIAPDEALRLLVENEAKQEQLIAKAELNKNTNLVEAKAALRKKRETYELLTEIRQNLLLLDQTTVETSSRKKELADLNQSIDNLSPLSQKYTQLLAELKEKETLLLQQKEDALKIASLEELRPDLVDGKACPLCGSLDHPFSAHSPEDHRPELDIKLKDNREALAREEEDWRKLSAQLTQAQTQKTGVATLLQEAETKHKDYSATHSKLKDQYQGTETLTAVSLTSRLPVLAQENLELEEAHNALAELKVNEELSQAFKDIKQFTADFKKLNQTRQNKFSETDIVASAKGYRDRFTLAQTNVTELGTGLSFEQNRLKQAKEQRLEIEERLTPLLSLHGFESIEAMNAGLLSETEADRIRNQRDSLNNQQTANQANLESLQSRKTNQTGLDTQPEMALETLITEKENNKAKRNTLAMELGGNAEKIKQDDRDKLLIQNKAEALEKLNKEVQKWSLLNKMIGDAFGNKFSNFAQGLTLQNLLVFTNRRLTKLSDRYLLDKPTGDGALKVIDQYQGNSERSVTTLSGGETFLISLALALSLSDMASKNVSLDSLFIDEGFGTLDQETLDIAMTTLERLQSESQKTVGVISHVEALKERITVQVKLEKNAQGYSSIKIE